MAERIEHTPSAQATIAAGWANMLPIISADPSFVVWKNLDRALRGHGDVDAACPGGSGDGVTERALDAARRESDYEVAVICDHLPWNRLVTFCNHEIFPSIAELHLCYQPFRRGVPWADPAALAALAHIDAGGIRRTRPAAEALVTLVTHGLGQSGRLELGADERATVRASFDADTEGITPAICGMAPWGIRGSLAAATQSLVDGGWNRAAALRAFWGFAALSLLHPSNLVGRFRARRAVAIDDGCPTIATTTRGRVVEAARFPALHDFVSAAERAHDRVVRLR